jgi:hypothetical protein
MKERIMAQKITVELLDDIDGSEAVGTFEFTHKGVEYAIDFNQTHMDEYTQMFEFLTQNARVIKGKKRAPYGSKKGTAVVGKTQEMREWLRAQGHDVKDRGRVPANLVKLWEERPQGDVTVIGEDDMREVAKNVAEKAPEKVEEAPKAETKPKAARKAPATRKKATAKDVTPATEELATLLKFEEPKDPAKTTRTRARRTSANKV